MPWRQSTIQSLHKGALESDGWGSVGRQSWVCFTGMVSTLLQGSSGRTQTQLPKKGSRCCFLLKSHCFSSPRKKRVGWQRETKECSLEQPVLQSPIQQSRGGGPQLPALHLEVSNIYI